MSLAPGDVVYVPRGAPHATMTGTAGSLHLSVAIERAVAPVAGCEHPDDPDVVSSLEIARALSDIVSATPDTARIAVADDAAVTVRETIVSVARGTVSIDFARDSVFGAALAARSSDSAVSFGDLDDVDLSGISCGVRQRLLVVR